jgi:hypothetical protein
MEKACPPDGEPDESFQYLVDTTSFELPKVRFDYDVSPPPPPPSTIKAYEALVALDPNGFEMVRTRLEEIFPRLSDVATSSVGANVGGYIADFTMTPNQITRAYLASYGMTKDGLGARVIESKHTGRWRPACKEMHNLFDDRYKAYAGTSSQAHINGNPHYNDNTHVSSFDRNLLLYAMLEIKMSLDKDTLANTPYSTLSLYDTICGSGVGGYRVPVEEYYYNTYSFKAGYELDTFAPVAMYGSLESVRSAHMAALHDCSSGFAPEDVALSIYCNGVGISGSINSGVSQSTNVYGRSRELRAGGRSGGRSGRSSRSSRSSSRYRQSVSVVNNNPYSHFEIDALQRTLRAPFAMQRDRLCNPWWHISIEQTLARPPQHEESDEELWDAAFRGAFATVTEPPDGLALVVPVWHRGEEKLTAQSQLLSMRSFVYITSSSDPSVRPGMHRMLDLPVFGNKRCEELPKVNCAPAGSVFYLNPGPAAVNSYESSVTYRTGRTMMRTIRCSSELAQFTGQACEAAPYASNAQDPGRSCYQGNLALLSRPVLYNSLQWLRTLTAPPPSPPPFSPSPPPPSPNPPLPPPPPSPPYFQPQSELMAYIRTVEEQACTSVYYLTTTTRCERLAVALTQSVLYDETNPPSPPPAQPAIASPPPPHPPPHPNSPPGLTSTPVASSRLSTMRFPIQQPPTRRKLNLFDDGYYATESDQTNMRSQLATVDVGAAVSCTEWQSAAPLPCVSGALASNCISGMRHCGTDAENSMEPFMELSFSGVPRTRGNRLWGFEVELPENQELAGLFFRSADAIGGSGYRVDVYKPDGSPAPCQKQAETPDASGLPENRKVQHVCLGGDPSDSDIYSLDQAYRLRITLLGTYRQIWVKSVSVVEISLGQSDLNPRPPAPPPLPMVPPSPPHSPTQACTFAMHMFYSSRTIVRKELCGLSKEQCCALARSASPEADSYEIDDSGCCALTHSQGTSLVADTQRLGFLSDRSGTGVL